MESNQPITKMREIDVLLNVVREGLPASFCVADRMIREVSDIIKMIAEYVEKHGNIALLCGSEWLYQDDAGQVDAIELVSKILDRMSGYADKEEGEGDGNGNE